MIQRDVRDVADIEGRTQLPRLLELLAIQAMSLLNVTELSRSMGIAHSTLKRYLSLLEDRSGRIAGIEVKASATLEGKNLRELDDLAQATGKRFRRGVLLYTGQEAIPFSPTVHALPISALWGKTGKRGSREETE